ncbi:hypothetical protein [Enterococcus asini]|uniref:hypothetical protein n=1 Tax=Enterococcus asini TaxID=57732 RepID=UPI00266CC207|nr:hypothetical protein [Enterococcus asini]
MKAAEQIFVSIRFLSLEEKTIKRIIQDWLVFTRILYRPLWLGLNQEPLQPFSLSLCLSMIRENCGENEFALRMSDGVNESCIHFRYGRLREDHILTKEIFYEHRQMILDYTEVQMNLATCAYIRDYGEYLHHNLANLKSRLTIQSQAEIDALPKVRRSDDQVEVDCSQFAGYDLYFGGHCLTSCWRMYFGEGYQESVPLEIIQDVQQVEQVRWLSHKVLMVELYRDPFRWADQRNQFFQRMFRDQLGIDQLAWSNGTGVLREPYIEYSHTQGRIQTVQYQNDYLQPTTKKQATHFVTRSFDVEKKQHQVKRVKGSLNTKAFFPIVDDTRMSMKNQVVLNPELSLDGGLAAYEFYIRNHLEIPKVVMDQRYREYLVGLDLYLPEEQIQNFPYQRLKEKMGEVRFSRLKKRRKGNYMDLTKGDNHLRVRFVAQETGHNKRSLWGEFNGRTSV